MSHIQTHILEFTRLTVTAVIASLAIGCTWNGEPAPESIKIRTVAETRRLLAGDWEWHSFTLQFGVGGLSQAGGLFDSPLSRQLSFSLSGEFHSLDGEDTVFAGAFSLENTRQSADRAPICLLRVDSSLKTEIRQLGGNRLVLVKEDPTFTAYYEYNKGKGSGSRK